MNPNAGTDRNIKEVIDISKNSKRKCLRSKKVIFMTSHCSCYESEIFGPDCHIDKIATNTSNFIQFCELVMKLTIKRTSLVITYDS